MRVALKRQEAIAALIGPEGEAEMRLTRMSGGDLRKDRRRAAGRDARRQGFFPGPRVALCRGCDRRADRRRSAAALKDWRPGDAALVVTAGGADRQIAR